MAENILSSFVYIFALVLLVTVVELSAVVCQLVRDVPVIRKKIWIRQNRETIRYRSIHK